MVRDSLLLSAIAAVLFVFNTTRLPVPQRHAQHSAGAWPTSLMALLMGTGLICALVGGVLLAQDVSLLLLEPFRRALWLIGLGLFLLGALWPASNRAEQPAFRWRRTEDGEFARVAASAASQSDASPTKTIENRAGSDLLAREHIITLLIGVLLVAALLRVWTAWSLPANCIGAECTRLLQDVDNVASPQPTDAGLVLHAVSQVTTRWIEANVRMLRLLGVVIGTLTVLAVFVFAHQVVRASGALAAAALLAVNAWHIQASVLLDPFSALPLLISLSGWTLLRFYRRGNLRWLAAASVAWGLLLFDTGALRLALTAWLLVAGGIGLFALPMEHWTWRMVRIAVWMLGALASAAPWLFSAPLATSSPPVPSAGSFMSTLWHELTTLFLPGMANGLAAYSESPPLGMLAAALFILGLGVLVRAVRQPAALLVLSNLVIGVVAVALVTTNRSVAESSLSGATPMPDPRLVLLPALFVSVAVALDQIIASFQQTWRALVSPARVATTALALLLVLTAPFALRTAGHMGTTTDRADTGLPTAAGRYLAEQLTADSDTPAGVTYFVPPALLADPALRATAGPVLEDASAANRVQTFEPMADLFFNAAQTDRVYLLSASEQPLVTLLRQLYPGGAMEQHPVADGNQPAFTTFRVPLSAVRDAKGLRAFYFAGDEIGPVSAAAATEPVRSLRFAGNEPPLAPPFSTRWEGSLLAPAAGNYTFFLEPMGDDSPFAHDAGDQQDAPQVILRLDGQLVLDTAADLREQRVPLARGPYRVDLRYRSGANPGGFAIRWQRPDGRTEFIPAELLHSPPVPASGLLGTYFAGERLGGPPLLHQKDLLIGLPVDLPRPYSVRWRGKLAASRAGEYLLGATTTGRLALRVKGQLLLDLPDASLREDNIGYREGLLYLARGWHDIEIEYVPGADSSDEHDAGVQLFWQPPGGAPDRLPARYLAPVTEQTAHAIRPLPTAPELTDAHLGDANFALTQAPAFRDPQVIVPPDALPLLSARSLWQRGNGCGAADGQFNAPRGVAIDAPAGLIYIADTGNRRVVAYDRAGDFVRSVVSEQFQEPFDVAVQPASSSAPSSERRTPLVLDAVAQQIWRIPAATDASAPPITALPLETSFYRPRGFDVDVLGNLFVADTGGGRVVVLSAEGEVIATSGGPDTLLGRGQPVDAALINGQLWAVTAEDGRLWRLQESEISRNGGITAVQPTNTFDAPHFAALPDRRFFLTDPMRSRVLLYAQNGQPLRQLALPERLQTPVGVAAAVIEGRTLLAVTDSAACRVSLWEIVTSEQ